MSKQVEDLLRKAVELAKRAGPVTPTLELDSAEHEALTEEAVRNGRIFGTPSRPA